MSNNPQDMMKACQKEMNTMLNNKIHYVFSTMTKEQLVAFAGSDMFNLNKDELNTMQQNDIALKLDGVSAVMPIKDKHKMVYSLLPILSKEQLVDVGQHEIKMMDMMMAQKMMGTMDEKQLKTLIKTMPAGETDTTKGNTTENMDSMMMNMDKDQMESMVEKCCLKKMHNE
jgi:hypothetical protein